MRTPGEATEEMEKIATHGSIQKSVMDAMVKKIAMGVSNQRTTNTVGNQECHCATEHRLSILSIPIPEHSVVFNCSCDARACVVLHTNESLMMLCTSEMRDIINDLPMTEDERMETFQLSDLSVAVFRNYGPIHLLKHVKCWRVVPQHEQ